MHFPINRVIKRVVVTPDKHFPLHDQKAINVLKKTIEIVQPDGYVDLGDVGEWEAFSAWKYKRKKAPPLEFLIDDFKKDVKDVNRGMDMIDESLDKVNCKEKYITEGNHDNWLNIAVDKYPYIPQYKFANAVNLADRGYTYYPFGKHLKISNTEKIKASIYNDNLDEVVDIIKGLNFDSDAEALLTNINNRTLYLNEIKHLKEIYL